MPAPFVYRVGHGGCVLKYNTVTVVTPGLLHFAIFLRFFAKFRKNTPKNTNKTEKMPGLLHFFDIFCNRPGVTTVLHFICFLSSSNIWLMISWLIVLTPRQFLGNELPLRCFSHFWHEKIMRCQNGFDNLNVTFYGGFFRNIF